MHIEFLSIRRLLSSILDFDPTFGTDGEVSLPVPASGPIKLQESIAVFPRTDGGLLVVGNGATPRDRDRDFATVIARFTAGGLLDTSFEENGVVQASVGGAAVRAVQDGAGNVVVLAESAGDSSFNSAAFYLSRYKPNGSLDRSFGDRGVVRYAQFAPGVRSEATHIAVAPDGRIAVLGVGGQLSVRIFDAMGMPDLNFGESATLLLDEAFPPSQLPNEFDQWSTAAAIAFDANGRLLAASERNEDVFVMAIDSVGAPDGTLSQDGLTKLNVASAVIRPDAEDELVFTHPNELLIDRDGSAFVVFRVEHQFVGNFASGVAVAKVLASGLPDATYSGDGVAFTQARDREPRATLDSRGRIYVADDRILQRLSARGAPDGQFAENGVFSLQRYSLFLGSAPALDSNGNALLLNNTPRSAQLSTGRVFRVGSRVDLMLTENGTLVVTGTPGGDAIEITKTSTGKIRLDINGAVSQFGVKSVLAINIDTGAGDDRVVVTPKIAATLRGGSGDDTLTTAAGRDSIEGGSGNDRISCGDGDDCIMGGRGDDRIFAGLAAGKSFDPFENAITRRIFGGSGNDEIEFIAGLTRVSDDSGDDRVTSTTRPPEEALEDTSDQFVGGIGEDTFSAAAAATFSDEGGHDSFIGSDGDDVFFSGPGDDTIRAGAGRDLVRDGTSRGSDLIDLGAGNDRADWRVDTGADTILGGPGDDSVTIGSSGGASLTFFGDAGNDEFYGSGVGRDFPAFFPIAAYGGAGSDTLLGGGDDDLLDGGDGNDSIAGYAGKDTMLGDNGDDLLRGHGGNDSIVGGTGRDKLTGDAGADTLIGNRGNDLFIANDGEVDELDGGSDRDRADRDQADILVSIEATP